MKSRKPIPYVFLLRHLIVTLFIALTVLLFEHYGKLDWMDSLTFRMATPLGGYVLSGRAVPENDPWQWLAPHVVLLDDELYESFFQQDPYLSKEKLREILDAVAKHHPGVLVIDLDMSPGVVKTPQPGSQQALDLALQQLAHRARLVLAAPIPVFNRDLAELKIKWVRDLCNAGAHFGYPYVLQTQGIVLRYPKKETLLSSIAYRQALQLQPPAGQRRPPPGPDSEKPDPSEAAWDICTQAQLGYNAAVFLDPRVYQGLQMQMAGLEHQVPINYGYLARSRQQGWLRPIKAWPPMSEADRRLWSNLGNKVVFLGMNNSTMDSFLTPEGMTAGVVIHATIFYSHLHPTSRIGPWKAFAFDVLLGFTLGLIFHRLWHRYNHAERQLDQAPRPTINRYLAARGWLILNFAFLGMVLAALMFTSGGLLALGAWLNPGPIILGRFIETLLSSRAGLRTQEGGLRPTARLDLIFGLLFLGLLWLLLAAGAH